MNILHSTGKFTDFNFTRSQNTKANYKFLCQHLQEIKKTKEEWVLDQFTCRSSQNVHIMENSYSYELPKNYKHMLFWSKVDLPDPKICEIIFSMFDEDKVDLIFENSENNKSVAGLRHYHFFVKID